MTFRASTSNDRKTEEEKGKKRLYFALLNFFLNKMNRLFGRPKPKEPSPSITDCIAGVNIHIGFNTIEVTLLFFHLCSCVSHFHFFLIFVIGR